MSAEACDRLLSQVRKVYHLAGVTALVEWDQQVNMPAEAAAARSEQLALLAELRHRLLTSSEFVDTLEAARSCPDLSADQRVVTYEMRREVERARRIPPALARALAAGESSTNALWIEARRQNSFSVVQPALESLLALKREYASALADGQGLYTALLDVYEPELTETEVERLFSPLRGFLRTLVEQCSEKSREVPAFAHQPLAREAQRELFIAVVMAMGFHFDAGRLDESVHPFCSGIAPTDVRMTVRFRDHDLSSGLYAAIHEAGHGLYDQGPRPEDAFTPLGEARSYAVHESQSLLWEKQVGRSAPFCHYLAGLLTKCLPSDFGVFQPAELYRSLNRVLPSLTRVEADEVSYGLHIILRYELERDLIRGSLTCVELPSAWSDKYRSYLGVTPADDLSGVLQDTHWYSGSFGYFPSYLLGAMHAAQLFAAYRAVAPQWKEQLSSGDFAALRWWLKAQIHEQGKRYSSAELLRRATGSPPMPTFFEAYLREKYRDLYGALV